MILIFTHAKKYAISALSTYSQPCLPAVLGPPSSLINTMATEPPSQETSTSDNDMLFKELDAYPWDRDAAFQVN
jgi:hypothetical protein